MILSQLGLNNRRVLSARGGEYGMKRTLERDIEDLESVKEAINSALKYFPSRKFAESEIQLRHDTVRNVLLIVSNEVIYGINEWKENTK